MRLEGRLLPRPAPRTFAARSPEHLHEAGGLEEHEAAQENGLL